MGLPPLRLRRVDDAWLAHAWRSIVVASVGGRTSAANAEALEEAQQVLDLQEAGLLPALYMLDPAAPA
jgi:hypothetical protein